MHYLITGGSSGIGAAVAVELGRRGHAVGLIARRAAQLEAVAADVRAAGGIAAWATADVLDRDAVAEAVRAVESELGPVDTLLANAGGGTPSPAVPFDLDPFLRTMRLNYDGTLHTLAAVLPAMVERGHGHVAAVSSVAGWRGLAPSGAYSAAKGAVTLLFEALAVELRPHGVAVTTIHPGFVRTPSTDKNEFSMPFKLEPDDAARRIANGLERRRRRIDFPLPMVLLMTWVRLLPTWLFEPLYARVMPDGGGSKPG